MKSILYSILFMFSKPVSLLAGNNRDTIIKGVNIKFIYKPSIFPDSWLTEAINAKGEPIITSHEISRMKSVMSNALSKYPKTFLTKELRTVYFLKAMSMYNVEFGGTNSTDAIYLTNNGEKLGYTDQYIEQTFHHEFSSILYRNYPLLLDTVAWKTANVTGFDYNDPEGGVGAIRSDKSSQEIDTALCRLGFLTQYSYSDIENDVNTIAQNLFRPLPGFWDVVNSYPRIQEKVRLLIVFYQKLSSHFTEHFFIKMK